MWLELEGEAVGGLLPAVIQLFSFCLGLGVGIFGNDATPVEQRAGVIGCVLFGSIALVCCMPDEMTRLFTTDSLGCRLSLACSDVGKPTNVTYQPR